MKNFAAVVQARMGSTRLPGKTLKELADKTVLGHIITRLKNARHLDQIIIATSDDEKDDYIEAECVKYDIPCFRGSQLDVLSRYYHAAIAHEVTDIVRVCADNALIDWEIIDEQVRIYQENNYELVTTGSNIPLGLGGEIFSIDRLAVAFSQASESYQREHVTPYLYEKCENVYYHQIDEDYSKYRLTLDTPEDWQLIQKIYEGMYKGKHDFCSRDVSVFLEKNPELMKINEHIKQIKVGNGV